MNKRSASRLACAQVAYWQAINPGSTFDLEREIATVCALDLAELDQSLSIESEFVARLMRCFATKVHMAMQMIAPHLKRPVESIPSLLLVILKLAACEMLFMDTPFKVVIKEYADMACAFFDHAETGFVQAILDKLAQDKQVP